MHVLFIHPSFPGPFAVPAHYATVAHGWPCTMLTSVDTRHVSAPFTHINYRLRDDVPPPATFAAPTSLNDHLAHLAAVYRGLRGLPALRPDLVVGHLTYGTMLYLRDLYPGVPFLGYFELYPGQFWGDGLVLRKEFPPPEAVRLANATFHALTLLQLHAVDAAYTPSHTQRAMCPAELRHKVRVLPEGVDCQAFQPRPRPAGVANVTVGPVTRVVTFVSRGLESVRGFDIFLKLTKRIQAQRADVAFLVVGAERTLHGHEGAHLGQTSFKQWALAQDDYDQSRIVFLGLLPPEQLAAVYNLSDLHVHLSVPHVPSASLLQAMASGCPILGSATPPVQEHLDDGVHGLLAGFDEVDALAEKALELLAAPERARQLGQEARRRVMEQYELGQCLRQLTQFFEEHGPRISPMDQAFASI